MNIRTLGLLLSVLTTSLLVAACETHRTEVRNLNNGRDGELALVSPLRQFSAEIPVGENLVVEVSHRESAVYDCVDGGFSIDFSSLGGGNCTYIGPTTATSPVVEILEAGCDDEACLAVIAGSPDRKLQISVTARVRGATQLRVTALLADGTSRSDRFPMYFLEADNIAVTCTEVHHCPGHNAVFPGMELHWVVAARDGQRVLSAPIAVTAVEPSDVIEVKVAAAEDASRRVISIRALKPGVATIHLSASGLETTGQVRVAGTDEVVRGEIRRVTVQWWADIDLQTDIFASTAASPYVSTDEAAIQYFAPVWVLRDGTLALGGANRVVTTANVELISDAQRNPNDNLSALTFRIFDVGTAHGSIPLTVRMGEAQIDWSLVIQ